jgi:hypothetical protein
MIETSRDKEDVEKALRNEKIILVPSIDKINSYWTLPISTPVVNNKVINTILYGV